MTRMADRTPTGPPGADLSSTAFAVRLALFYAAIFIVYGVQVPYLPVWLDAQGLTAREVAIVTAAPFLLRLVVSPGCALVADRMGAHRQVILALAWTALAAVLLLGSMAGFTGILVVTVVFALASASIMPLTETIAVAGTRERGLDYGRIRLWGSLSFVAVGLVGGALLDRVGAEAALWLLAIGAAATVAAGHALPRPDAPPQDEGPPGPRPAGLISADVARLVRSPVFVAFILAVSTTQASHGLFYTFGALHLQKLGVSGTWIGVQWAVAVLTEVMLFAVAGSLLASAGPKLLIAAGGAAAVVRWTAMSFDPPLAVLVGLQGLHALTFGATHLGAMRFIAEAAPPAAAGTAQALHSSFAAGIVMGLSIMLSGTLYEAFAGRAFLAMAVLGLMSLLATLFIVRRWDGRRL